MNSHGEINNNTKSKRTKAIAASISISGMIVAGALLSLTSSYQQPALAQQQSMTATNASSIGGTSATSTASGGSGAQSSSACFTTQSGAGSTQSNMTSNLENSSPRAGSLTGGNATGGGSTANGGVGTFGGGGGSSPGPGMGTNTTGGGSAATVTNATSGTTSGVAAGNQLTESVAGLIEQACSALQGGDIQAALMQLNSALSELRGSTQSNMTSNLENSSPRAGSLTGSG